MQALEKLLAAMTSVMQSQKRRIQRRKICCEERLWKSQLNFTVAKAHLAVLYRSLDQLHAEDLEHRFTPKLQLIFIIFMCFSRYLVTSVTLTSQVCVILGIFVIAFGI